MTGALNRWCFVPGCKNTSKNAPNKKFLCVPNNYSRRVNWFKAARRDIPKSKSIFFCCEDHFNLEEDMENYLRYRLVGGKMTLKQGVVPHIFDRQSDRKQQQGNRLVNKTCIQDTNKPEYLSSVMDADQPSTSTRQDRLGVDEHVMKQLHHQDIVQIVPTKSMETKYNESKYLSCVVDFDQSITNTGQVKLADDHVVKQRHLVQIIQTKSVGVQVKPSFCSKYVSCKIEYNAQRIASPSGIPIKNINNAKKTVFTQTVVSSDNSEESRSSVVTTDSDLKEAAVLSNDEKDEQKQASDVTSSLIATKSKNYLLDMPDS